MANCTKQVSKFDKAFKACCHSLKVSVTVPDSGSLNTFSLELHESSLTVSKGGNIIFLHFPGSKNTCFYALPGE